MSLRTVASVAQPMVDTRVTWIDTNPEAAAALRTLLAAGRAFFTGDSETKDRVVPDGTMTGWRKVGIEYSVSPDRPDLNETFCFRERDDRAGVLPAALLQHPLLHACRVAQKHLDAIAASVLSDLSDIVGVRNNVAPVRTMGESWLQLNWSTPAVVERDFIQDAHEDGHLITLLLADADGLEVLPNNMEWLPVLPTPERVICFGGECGALLSGDAIAPTLHRVRANKHVPSRLSVAYFVNPDLDQELPPWVATTRNASVDLLRWGQENPARFGLPYL
jgi:isopenicillin N synthase-like dioxygenase